MEKKPLDGNIPELVQEQDLDLQSRIEFLNSCGIAISKREALPEDGLIEIPKSQIHQFEPFLHALPAVASGAATGKALGKNTLYTITMPGTGENVFPDMLARKKNGALISNLAGDKYFLGRQTDVNPADLTSIRTANLINGVFAAASAVVSMHYLKEINDQLRALESKVGKILEFLDCDKRSAIKADLFAVQDTCMNAASILKDTYLRQSNLSMALQIRQRARTNIEFYDETINRDLTGYCANKKKGDLVGIVNEYEYFRCSVQIYAIARLLEIHLADSANADFFESVKKDLEKIRKELARFDRLIEDLKAEKAGLNKKKRANTVVDGIAGAAEKNDNPLIAAAGAGFKMLTSHKGNILDEQLKNISLAEGELTSFIKADPIKPVKQTLDSVQRIRSRPLRLVTDGERIYIEG